MTGPRIDLLATGLLGLALPAQELVWQIPGSSVTTLHYDSLAPFADYDHDGVRDLVVIVAPDPYAINLISIRIISGRDGATLWQQSSGCRSVAHAGDVDGDGEPDLAIVQPFDAARDQVAIWSPAHNQFLWRVIGFTAASFGAIKLGGIDADGDGFDDLIACTQHFSYSNVLVYDHLGTLRYTLPLTPINFIPTSVANMGDMDGDGCDDFVVGCAEPSYRGALRLVSGLTGATLHTSYGLLPGDATSAHAANMGDLDGDGINDYVGFPDYAASRAIIVAFSGATGSVVRTWPGIAQSAICSEDVDLDGVRDIVFSHDYIVAVGPPMVTGRTRALSGRDSTSLWTVDNFLGSGSSGQDWGRYAGGLGVVPGSPYPAVAWMDRNYRLPPSTGNGRVRAFRGGRAGQGPVTGTPCSSAGPPPQIGARDTAGGSRITIARSRPGAFAILSLALGNQTTFAGQPLPLSLDPYGLPGCAMYVGPDTTMLRVLGTAGIDRGYAAVDLAFHLVTAGLGTVVTAQWFVLDPTTMDYAATAKHELRMQ